MYNFFKKICVADNLFDIINSLYNFSYLKIIVYFRKDSPAKLFKIYWYTKLRLKKISKTNNSYSNNILVLFFYSVSRVDLLAQLNKNWKFVDKFMPYKTFKKYKYADRKFDSFQLLIMFFALLFLFYLTIFIIKIIIISNN